ncbi:hypothetical protein [Nocardia vermiculata]|uniref:Uncharacterized protein n=1 Tax=Nocardia vermiculata TaxID=257274 RepID=A0A846Y0G2_9NOCA|nr:hypothetical protein [Nocardia vermiculata]NKY51500.1 hypothetical protein [Nocardia vermiculata]
MPKSPQLQRIRRISAGALAAAAVLAGGISVELNAAATSSAEALSGVEAPAVSAGVPQVRSAASREWAGTTPLREGDRDPDSSTAGS